MGIPGHSRGGRSKACKACKEDLDCHFTHPLRLFSLILNLPVLLVSNAVASQTPSARVNTVNSDICFTRLLNSITAALSDPGHHHPGCTEGGRRVKQKGFAADSGGAHRRAMKERRVFSFFVSFSRLSSKSSACRTNDSLLVCVLGDREGKKGVPRTVLKALRSILGVQSV